MMCCMDLSFVHVPHVWWPSRPVGGRHVLLAADESNAHIGVFPDTEPPAAGQKEGRGTSSLSTTSTYATPPLHTSQKPTWKRPVQSKGKNAWTHTEISNSHASTLRGRPQRKTHTHTYARDHTHRTNERPTGLQQESSSTGECERSAPGFGLCGHHLWEGRRLCKVCGHDPGHRVHHDLLWHHRARLAVRRTNLDSGLLVPVWRV
mmetsp:Transcript_31882/g.92339  ORF Transcript_31882/g.92339 Transcript_31882/m.92339 type:complete len:205 (+) Transcript_31882:146-760(+)